LLQKRRKFSDKIKVTKTAARAYPQAKARGFNGTRFLQAGFGTLAAKLRVPGNVARFLGTRMRALKCGALNPREFSVNSTSKIF